MIINGVSAYIKVTLANGYEAHCIMEEFFIDSKSFLAIGIN